MRTREDIEKHIKGRLPPAEESGYIDRLSWENAAIELLLDIRDLLTKSQEKKVNLKHPITDYGMVTVNGAFGQQLKKKMEELPPLDIPALLWRYHVLQSNRGGESLEELRIIDKEVTEITNALSNKH